MLVTDSQTGKFGVVPLVVSASMPPANIARPESLPVGNSSPVAIRLTFMPPPAPGAAAEPAVNVHEATLKIECEKPVSSEARSDRVSRRLIAQSPPDASSGLGST